MLFDRNYNTIAQPTEATYTDKGSRFLAFSFPVNSEAEIKQNLATLKLQYPDATHHCYVWILNPDKSAQRINDDGEPANTAARPILKYINALNLTNILVVVIRYFGGKKLGIPGLIDAYGMAAKLCLEKTEIVIKTLLDYFKIEVNFENEHMVYNLARKFSAIIEETTHTQNVVITLSINGSKTEAFIAECRNLATFEYTFFKTE
ncbi:MAG: IMPACT family protein [Bacteroidia bacterium]